MNGLVISRAVRSARKPKGGGHERRGKILAAAAKVFNSLGYGGATIQRIADDVGLSSTALHMHFHDKDEILVEICEGAMEQLLALGAEIAARPVPAADRARAMIDAQGRLHQASPAEAAQVLWAAGHGLTSLMITQTGRQWSPADDFTRTLLDAMVSGLFRA